MVDLWPWWLMFRGSYGSVWGLWSLVGVYLGFSHLLEALRSVWRGMKPLWASFECKLVLLEFSRGLWLILDHWSMDYWVVIWRTLLLTWSDLDSIHLMPLFVYALLCWLDVHKLTLSLVSGLDTHHWWLGLFSPCEIQNALSSDLFLFCRVLIDVVSSWAHLSARALMHWIV